MRRKNYKGRCEKRSLNKCNGVCRTYDKIQYAYADLLEKSNLIKEFDCNVPLDNADYTSDFVCIKADNTLMVRECVERTLLTKPRTVKLLDFSREYWLKHGVEDWGIVTNGQKAD
mgnify:FL=1